MYIFPGEYPAQERLRATLQLIRHSLANIVEHYESAGQDNEETAVIQFIPIAIDQLDATLNADPEDILNKASEGPAAFYAPVLSDGTPIQFIWPSYEDVPSEEYLKQTYLTVLKDRGDDSGEKDTLLVDITDSVAQGYEEHGGTVLFYQDIVAHTTFTVGHILSSEEGFVDDTPTWIPPAAMVRPYGGRIEWDVREAFGHLAFSMSEYMSGLEEDRYTPLHRFGSLLDIRMSSLANVMYAQGHDVDNIRQSAKAAADAITGLFITIEDTPEHSDDTPDVPVRVAFWYGNEFVSLAVLGTSADALSSLMADTLYLPTERVPSLAERDEARVTPDTDSVPVGLVVYPEETLSLEEEHAPELLEWLTIPAQFPLVVSVSNVTLSDIDQWLTQYQGSPNVERALSGVYKRLKSALGDMAETQF